MTSDPRLTNPALLTLAAVRLRERRLRQIPDWRTTEGMCALLDAAKHLPQRDPWDLPGVYEGAPGFAGLLWEARQMPPGGRS